MRGAAVGNNALRDAPDAFASKRVLLHSEARGDVRPGLPGEEEPACDVAPRLRHDRAALYPGASPKRRRPEPLEVYEEAAAVLERPDVLVPPRDQGEPVERVARAQCAPLVIAQSCRENKLRIGIAGSQSGLLLPLKVLTVTIDGDDPTAAPGPLRARREAFGLTQETLASLVGCSLSSIAQLERGYSPHRSTVRIRIESILDELDARVVELKSMNHDEGAAASSTPVDKSEETAHARPEQ